ncbi:MAG: PrsW family intramembrane metalloprotease [Bacteroidales bacterium]|nr:PrsW family intramembrane metalloprotease [Bacteroidales bacterium]
MIVIYLLLSLFIAWIWIEYFILIDIFEKEKLKIIILTFLLGCASVLVVFMANKYVPFLHILQLNGTILNDFLFCEINIGMVEEIAKAIPFLIIYFLFKSEISEPIDYLVFFSISALGFSAMENVLYMYHHGIKVITGRSILSTVGHVFDTALIAYGFILYHYRNRHVFTIFLFFILAATSHAFYDFWLIFEETRAWGGFITVLYFFITISLFAVILNNALNNSSFFTYKKVVNSEKIISRLLTYYGLVILVQFIVLTYQESFKYAVSNFTSSLYFAGFIIVVTVVRLSRFNLVKDRWENLKFEMPFSLSTGGSYYAAGPNISLQIKGESSNEAYFNRYYQAYFKICPISGRNTQLERPRLTYITKKFYLKDHQTFFLVKVFDSDENGNYEMMLMSPKQGGITYTDDDYPIVALLTYENLTDLDSMKLTAKDFSFVEWAYVTPRE